MADGRLMPLANLGRRACAYFRLSFGYPRVPRVSSPVRQTLAQHDMRAVRPFDVGMAAPSLGTDETTPGLCFGPFSSCHVMIP